MPLLKVGLHLPSLRQPFKKALLTAARMGVQGVEIDARRQVRPGELSQTGLRDMRKLLDDLGLRVAAVSFATRRGYHEQEELDERVAATKEVMRMAYALGSSVVVNQVGYVPSADELSTTDMDRAEAPGAIVIAASEVGLDVEAVAEQAARDAIRNKTRRDWQVLLDVLKDLAQFGDRVGARLAARTGNESAADLAHLLQSLPEGSLSIDLDPGSLAVNGFPPLDVVRRLGPAIVHVHARDGVRDRAMGRGIEVPLGRGTVDFPAILAGLQEHNYRGFYTLQTEEADNPHTALATGLEYLQNLAGAN